jgi:hypothetical protein
MFKQAKDLKEGDTVIDRGRRFTVKRIIVNADTGMISIVNTDDSWHGEYHPEEYLGVIARAGIQLSTHRFAELLKNAQSWDRRHASMCHAQTEWLTGNFVFADNLRIHVNAGDLKKWDTPQRVNGKTFTRCR